MGTTKRSPLSRFPGQEPHTGSIREGETNQILSASIHFARLLTTSLRTGSHTLGTRRTSATESQGVLTKRLEYPRPVGLGGQHFIPIGSPAVWGDNSSGRPFFDDAGLGDPGTFTQANRCQLQDGTNPFLSPVYNQSIVQEFRLQTLAGGQFMAFPAEASRSETTSIAMVESEDLCIAMPPAASWRTAWVDWTFLHAHKDCINIWFSVRPVLPFPDSLSDPQ